jgi:starch phosphorylase
MQPTSPKPLSYESFPSSGLVAYFSMEIAIAPHMPTYSGGLGVLAGDTLRSTADQGVPLAAFTLVHRKGYFQQHLDENGVQREDIQPWDPAHFCTEEKARVTVSVEDRIVTVRAWRYELMGRFGHVVPIYLLDTDIEENSGWDRGLTDHLYGGDSNYRLQQEIVLGMGGVRMAKALGHRVNVYHMNEGHAALLTLGLLESQLGGGPLGAATEADIEQVRNQCVFTTHTPVSAGHDRFSTEQASRILGGDRTARLEKMGCFRDGMLNMTLLALRFSRNTPRSPARCSRNSPSTRSPTGFTRPPGSPRPSSSCWMRASPHGGAITSICAAPSTSPNRRFSPPTPATRTRCSTKWPRTTASAPISS